MKRSSFLFLVLCLSTSIFPASKVMSVASGVLSTVDDMSSSLKSLDDQVGGVKEELALARKQAAKRWKKFSWAVTAGLGIFLTIGLMKEPRDSHRTTELLSQVRGQQDPGERQILFTQYSQRFAQGKYASWINWATLSAFLASLGLSIALSAEKSE
jgi:hypothetical protein